MPEGCLPQPPAYHQVVDPHRHPAVIMEHLDSSFEHWMSGIEDELADICGLTGDDRAKATCRADGQMFVWRAALGKVGSPFPRSSDTTHVWRIITEWLGQLQQALCSFAHVTQMADGGRRAHRQHHPLNIIWRVQARILLHSWEYLGASEPAAAFQEWVKGLKIQLLAHIPYVVAVRWEASKRPKEAAARDAAERRQAWVSWLHEGPAAGLGRQHCMSRVSGGSRRL